MEQIIHISEGEKEVKEKCQYSIGIICPSDFTKLERSGGTSGFLVNIFSVLSGKVLIYGIGLSGTPVWQKISLQPNINFIAITDIKYPSLIPMRLRALFWYLLYRNRILQSKVDVLYLHSPECALPFIFFKKRIPLIFHQHGSGNPVKVSKFIWARKRPLIKVFDLMLKLIHKRADWIIAIDDLCFEQAKQNGAGNKVTLIKNAIDIEAFRPDPETRESMRGKLGLKDKQFVVLFVGRLEQIKAVDRAIDALAYLKKGEMTYHLYLAGEGSLKKDLKKYVNKKQLQSYVTFLGQLPHSYLPAYYNLADVLVLPSQMEGIPMVILEALACGTPVVASRVGGIPNIIVEGVNGVMIDDPSPSNLARTIEIVCSQNLDRHKIAESVKHLSSHRFVVAFEKIIDNLIRSKQKDENVG